MSELPVWKRALAFVGLVAVSVWLTAMGLQTIHVECAPGKDGVVACVHEMRYAGVTTATTPFTPTADRVTWSRGQGKHQRQGTVSIRPLTGDTVKIEWLSADEAERIAAELVRDPDYAIDSTGPRWWLLFLLLTIPFAVSMVLPPSKYIPSLGKVKVPPVPQTKKAARMERRKARKARERARQARE